MKKYVSSLLLALIFITLTSKLSPIYPVNDWCDTNSFFTMGKALINGIDIYKDLFEQKGPFLYLIYGIGYIISNKSFLGVYIMEVISFTFFLKITYETLCIIECKNKKYIMLFIPFMITTSIAFYGGGSAEEFCLPFIAYNIKLIVKYLKKIEITNKEYFISGIFASLVILIKFNIVSFWFGFIILSIISKKYKELGYFFLGLTIPVIITILFFNKNLPYFIDVYFIKNIVNYNKKSETIITNVTDGFMNLFIFDLIENIFLVISMTLSFLHMHRIKKIREYILVFLFPFVFICCQNVWFKYYALPFCIFSIIGLIIVFNKINLKRINKYIYTITIIILTIILGKNTFMLKYKKENFVQYKFAEIINKYEDKTILNYGFIDTGFYLVTDTIPNVRFFHTMNFDDFREMKESQQRYIKNKKTNFVICISIEKNFECNNEFVLKNYKLLDIERHNDDYGLYYALYVRRNEDDKKNL